MIKGSIGKGTSQHEWSGILQRLLNQVYPSKEPIAVDGVFGAETETRLKRFQKDARLVVDGRAGVKTFQALLANEFSDTSVFRKDHTMFLSELDLQIAADKLQVELAVIHAVKEVESLGNGFINQRPVILFEGHVFWKRLAKYGIKPHEHREGNETILYPKWTSRYYKGGLREYDRLYAAIDIHHEAALESASWGLFQIMGYHWERLGYDSVRHYEAAMYEDEGKQLAAFVRYVGAYGLKTDLRKKRWTEFARKYNGPRYDENSYDRKLKKAYDKFKNKL